MVVKKRSKKSKKPIKKTRSLFKFLLLLIFWSILIATAVLGYYLYKLDKEVISQFEGDKWLVPAHVYSRPLEIYAGQKMSIADLSSNLDRLGYRQQDYDLNLPGSYRILQSTVEIFTREFFISGTDRVLPKLYQMNIVNDRVNGLKDVQSDKSTNIVRLEPQLIGSLRSDVHEDRQLISLNDVPKAFIAALLMTEDKNFMSHHGVSIKGITRAMVVNIKAGRFVQGGSTITQQLVKNFYLSSDRKLKRKIKEALMAILLELHYEKDEILETYINEVYLGQAGNRAIHGFNLASRFYFGRPLKELQLHEMALFAGMVKGPSEYNPIRQPEKAKQRRNVVLSIMANNQLINEQQLAYLSDLPLGVVDNNIIRKNNNYPAFLATVREELVNKYDEQLLNIDEVKVFTTLDIFVQQAADKVLTDTLNRLETERKMEVDSLQGAIVVVDVNSGGLLAISSDRNPNYMGFNRALDARRQIGSLAKIAVYLAAIEQKKISLTSPVQDTRLTVRLTNGQTWTPGNYDKKYLGDIRAIDALADSRNIPAVRVGLDAGIENVAKLMNRLGLKGEIPAYPSIVLGSTEHSPMEVAQMFQTIANVGYQIPLRSINAVVDNDHQLNRIEKIVTTEVVNSDAAYVLDFALQEVVNSGTARSLRNTFSLDKVIAGKTGTTNDYRDSWFAGYTGNLLAVVWVGRDDNKVTGLSGGSGALKVWQALFEKLGTTDWLNPAPPGIDTVAILNNSYARTDRSCKESKIFPFVRGTEPQHFISCDGLVNRNIGGQSDPTQVQNKEGIQEKVSDWFETLFGRDAQSNPPEDQSTRRQSNEDR